MLIGVLALITALAISSVAIYYSVAGLVAIFAAAAIPIIIMGSVLEVGKLVTAVWLHRNWHIATWWLKTYLATAVVVLMFITSMGIFGFLSKAHIEQTAGAEQSTAQIEKITERIEYNQEVIEKSESKIDELQSGGSTVETSIREEIQREQERIDTAYDRVQPAIQEQREVIAKQSQLYQDQLDDVDSRLDRLERYIEDDEVEKAQALVGVDVDGDYGPNTADAVKEYKKQQEQKKDELVSKIESSQSNNQVVQRAREEIGRLQERADRQIADSERTIKRLRERLEGDDSNNIETLIAQQNKRIQESSSTVEELTDQQFELESEYRKLEAEVGPLRYIAEFVYGDDTGEDLLEKAVQWVILVIIFVFDPLAVLLLIASQYSIVEHRKKKSETVEQTTASALPISDPEPVRSPDTDAVEEALSPKQQKPKPESGEPDKSVQPPDLDWVVPEHAPKLSDEELDTATDASEEFKAERERLYNEKEQDESFKNKKTKWKEENPNETLKHYKKLYVHGVIDSLPWE